MLVRDAIRAFLEAHFAAGQRARRTRHAYTVDLRQFRDFVGLSCDLRDTEPELVERWIAHLHDASYAPASIQRKLSVLHARVMHRPSFSASSTAPTTRDLVWRRSPSFCSVGSVRRRARPDGVPAALTLLPLGLEQRILRRATKLRKAGRTLREIASYLNRRGHTTRTGAPWAIRKVHHLLQVT